VALIIELNDAEIYQRENRVLKNVDLKVEKGEFIYVIGRVGSGKSSLLKTLYNELPLINGEGFIAGYNLKKIKRREIPYLRRKLGIIFQDFQLLADRSVFNNLEFVLKATGWKQERAIRDRINEVLDIVGMRYSASKMPHRLSGGEQQRIVVARALLNNPEIILADEPTGNLDPETSEALMDVLQEINREGKTIIFATHDYPLIKKYPARKLSCESEILREVGEEEETIDFEVPLDD
jgi:cell division transport system ATP-binding protein